MKTMNKIIFISIFLFICAIRINAQEATLSAGGESLGTGGSASYSVGQVACSTVIGVSGTITEGVQQPFEIYAVNTGINVADKINLTFNAYPNPVSKILTLDIGSYNSDNLSYQLFDNSGRLLGSNQVTDSKTDISLENVANGVYFLRISQNGNQLIYFKIIKN